MKSCCLELELEEPVVVKVARADSVVRRRNALGDLLCRVEARTFVSSSSTVVVTSPGPGCFSLLSWTSGSDG